MYPIMSECVGTFFYASGKPSMRRRQIPTYVKYLPTSNTYLRQIQRRQIPTYQEGI